jgi:ureidoglycolate dehydrogenase (NAD+)
VPAGAQRPIFLDIATSAVAGVKVYQAQTEGRPIPADWLIDREGCPTSDPAGFPDSKTLRPMAGHKGYGIALLIEILAGVLAGAGVTREVRSWIFDDPTLPTGHGAAFLALNVGALMPVAAFKERVDQLIDEIHQAPLARDADRVRVPGEMEWERRDRALAEGLVLPGDVAASLRGLADDLQSGALAALLASVSSEP